jgi:hypothetical protein
VIYFSLQIRRHKISVGFMIAICEVPWVERTIGMIFEKGYQVPGVEKERFYECIRRERVPRNADTWRAVKRSKHVDLIG